MPRLFQKNPKTGMSKLVYVPPTEVQPVEVNQPATVTLPEGNIQIKKFRCTVCGKQFVTVGVTSIHINRHHAELVGEDKKDGWRKYSESINGANSPNPSG